MLTFDLAGEEYIALCNLLKVTGLCGSGGFAKTEISAGQVRVDGLVELRKRAKVRSGQVVGYANQEIVVSRNGAP